MVRRITRRITEMLARAAARVEAQDAKAQLWAGTLCESQSMRGRLSFRNASFLRRALFELLGKPRKVLGLRCDKVEFCDGAAIAAVLEFAMACKERGTRLYLMDPSESLTDAFRLYGLGKMLDALSTHGPVLPTNQSVNLGDEPLLIVMEDEFADSIRIEPVGEAA